MSPERAGSPQDEVSLAPKMSVPASPVAGTPLREAQSPISLLLAVAQGHGRNPDDDLTSLSWLHEKDLLKGMNINPSPLSSTSSTPKKYYNGIMLADQSPTSDYVEEINSVSTTDSSNSSVNSPLPTCNVSQVNQQRNKHPHNIPYDPLVHTNNKPPYSFSCLIFMAIEDSEQKALPVKEIYAWIMENFPYFQNAPTGWKNSVRHNLSLNKCFQKVEKAPNLGKGSLWTVDPQYKPNLIQALARSPFPPCTSIDTSSYINPNRRVQRSPPPQEKNSVSRLPNPELFPYLSRKLAATNETQDNGFKSNDSLDEVDAAAVMLSLKNGLRYTKKDKNTRQVITTSPSQDHTYSAADASEIEIKDEAFESEDERLPKTATCRKIDFEDEEEQRITGAETLLNLAGITTRKRSISQSDQESKMLKLFKDMARDEESYSTSKPTPFKPRLLRTKKKEGKDRVLFNNNNNNNEWVKHRRELDINQDR